MKKFEKTESTESGKGFKIDTWKNRLIASVVLSALLAKAGMDHVKEEAKKTGYLVHEEKNKLNLSVAENQIDKSDQELAKIKVKIEEKMAQTPPEWDDLMVKVESKSEKILTFENLNLEPEDKLRKEVESLLEPCQQQNNHERGIYLVKKYNEMVMDFKQTKDKTEKEKLIKKWLLFRNEFIGMTFAGDTRESLQAAIRAGMLPTKSAEELLLLAQALNESNVKLLVDFDKPMMVKDGDKSIEFKLPATEIHQLVGDRDIVSNIAEYGMVEFENLVELKKADPETYRQISELFLIKQTNHYEKQVLEKIKKYNEEHDKRIGLTKEDEDVISKNIYNALKKSLENKGKEEKVKLKLTPFLTLTGNKPEEIKDKQDISRFGVKFEEIPLGQYKIDVIADLLHKYDIFGHQVPLPTLGIEGQKTLEDKIEKDAELDISLSANQEILAGKISAKMLCKGNFVYIIMTDNDGNIDLIPPQDKPMAKFKFWLFLPIIPLLIPRLRRPKIKVPPIKPPRITTRPPEPPIVPPPPIEPPPPKEPPTIPPPPIKPPKRPPIKPPRRPGYPPVTTDIPPVIRVEDKRIKKVGVNRGGVMSHATGADKKHLIGNRPGA